MKTLLSITILFLLSLWTHAAPVDRNITTTTGTVSAPVPSSSGAVNATLLALEVKAKADEADKSINHLKKEQFVNQTVVSGGDWLLFFGSVKCPHCQKLTPEFLKYQQRKEKDFEKKNLRMAKVECTELKEICLTVIPELKFYPTIRIYKGGKYYQEFDGDDEIELIEAWVDKYLESQHGDGAKAVKKAQQIAEAGLNNGKGGVSSVNPSGKSVEITSKNIESLLDQSAWFIKFYSPYCGHCKMFAPMWIEVATELKGVVNVGEVDCTVEMDLCKKYDIQMYPTVMHVGASLGDQFKGDRTKPRLLQFAKQYLKPSFNAVSADEVNTILLTNSGLSMFYLYDETTPLAYVESFAKVASSVNHIIEINVCPEAEAKKHFAASILPNHKPPYLLVSQGESDHKDTRVFQASLQLNTDGTRSNLRSWIIKHSKPVLQKLDETTSKGIMNGKNAVALGIVKGSSEASKKAMIEVLRAAGKKWEGHSEVGTSVDDEMSLVEGDEDKKRSVVFAWIDVLEKGDYIQRAFGVDVKTARFPQLVVVDTTEDLFYDAQVDGIKPLDFSSAQTILDHLNEVFAGKLRGKNANGSVYTAKVFHRLTKPFADMLYGHPLLSGLIIFGVLVMLIRCATLGDTSSQYSAVLKEPKSD
ncbi:hypothetical protein BDR26DRAFT_570924 [Obelidium mucronatum]|nr:hypothetical protein BDR26DRAFT_570924 [Obelidium mucronatum]